MGKPRPPGNEDVHEAVVVVIRLNAKETAELAGNARLLGTIGEGSVSLIAIKQHALGRVERRDGEVEETVVVKVFHHRASGLIEPVDSGPRADVAKLPDVEFRLHPMIKRDQILGVDLLWIFSEGHVSNIQEPANFQIVGEFLEVFREVLDCDLRPLGNEMPRGGGDRQNARTLAATHHAILGLAAPQAGDPFKVDQGVKPRLGQLGLRLRQRACFLKNLVRLGRFPLGVMKHRLCEQKRDFLIGRWILLRDLLVNPLIREPAGFIPALGEVFERCLGVPSGKLGEKGEVAARVHASTRAKSRPSRRLLGSRSRRARFWRW